MMRALLLAAAIALPAHAVAEPFRGDAYRYPSKSFFPRLVSDFAAIPTGVPHWSAAEWAWFGTTAAVTVALFLPLDRPLDQRFQSYLAQEHPRLRVGLWSARNDLFILGGTLAVGAGVVGYGYFARDDAFIETFSLMVEAVAITQTFHISTKLLLSRDGPDDGNGHTIAGPTAETFERFPNGAPSGHTATLFALATVAAFYWDHPWLSVAVYGISTAFATALVLDRYHYISDVLAGASLGVAVGRYVVRQRSSRFQTVDGVPRRKVELVPTLVPSRGGAAPGGVIRVDL